MVSITCGKMLAVRCDMNNKIKQPEQQKDFVTSEADEQSQLHAVFIKNLLLLRRALIGNELEYQFDDLIWTLANISLSSSAASSNEDLPARLMTSQDTIPVDKLEYSANTLLMNERLLDSVSNICEVLNNAATIPLARYLVWVEIAIQSANLEICNQRLNALVSSEVDNAASQQMIRQKTVAICHQLAEHHHTLAKTYSAKGGDNAKPIHVRQALDFAMWARKLLGDSIDDEMSRFNKGLFYKYIARQRQFIRKLEFRVFQELNTNRKIKLLRKIARKYVELAGHYEGQGENKEYEAALELSHSSFKKVAILTTMQSRSQSDLKYKSESNANVNPKTNPCANSKANSSLSSKAVSRTRLHRGIAKLIPLGLFRLVKRKPDYSEEMDFIAALVKIYIEPPKLGKDLQSSFANRIAKVIGQMAKDELIDYYHFLAGPKMQEIMFAVNFQFGNLQDDMQLFAYRALTEVLHSVANAVTEELVKRFQHQVSPIGGGQPEHISETDFDIRILELLKTHVAKVQGYNEFVRQCTLEQLQAQKKATEVERKVPKLGLG